MQIVECTVTTLILMCRGVLASCVFSELLWCTDLREQ